jgi:inosine-uridine nucleoside N-ribohydrolase
LNGKQLVAKKVKYLSAMAGEFPTGEEYNVRADAASSVIVFEQWPTRIVFSGYEIGVKIPNGKRLVASGIDTPCREAYMVCFRQDSIDASNGIKSWAGDLAKSWDQTSVLVAAYGVDRYFNTVKGRITVTNSGRNGWEDDPKGKHEYLTWKAPVQELIDIIEELMMHEPVR